MTKIVHASMMDSLISMQTTDSPMASNTTYSTGDNEMDYKAAYMEAMNLIREMKKMLEAEDAKRTQDGRSRVTRDTILTPPTAAEWAAYGHTTARVEWGKVWDGTWKPYLDALAPDVRQKLFEQMDSYRAAKRTTDHAGRSDQRARHSEYQRNSELANAGRQRWGRPAV